MPTAATPIPLCQVGGVSLVSAEFANKLIVPVNAILQGKIAPIAGCGTIAYAGGQFIIDLTPLVARITALESAFLLPPGGSAGQVLTKNSNANYDVKWADVDVNINVCCDAIQGQVDDINDRLDNATISASCSDGNVSVDLNI